MKSTQSHRVIFAATSALMLGVVALLDSNLKAESTTLEQGFIQRVVAQTSRAGVAIRATRELRAGTVSGKHEGWMRVETTLTPAGAFSWSVIDQGGSSRTREKVLQTVLETEARDDERDAAALTPANYQFTPLGTTPNGDVQLRLEPRRKDSRLIDGTLTVSPDGSPVRLEGRLAKSPSFWVKSVQIVREYGRFAGVALPTLTESTADLKIFGKSVFTMRYSYKEVNGRRLPRAMLTADLNQ